MYSDDGDPNYVRAFALDITVDGGAVITAVTAASSGDNDAPGQSYGIFPGSFARVIDPVDPNWADPDYSPVGNPNDLPGDTQPGINTSGVTVEMGSLYVDGNSPAPSGPLCTIEVDQACNVTLSVNQGRAGVVTEAAEAIVPTLTGGPITCGGCATCLGDLDGNQWVMTSDYLLMMNLLGQKGSPYRVPQGDPLWNDCADVDGNGWIMTSDLLLLKNKLGLAGSPYRIPCSQIVWP
jgi:hypothetical protein